MGYIQPHNSHHFLSGSSPRVSQVLRSPNLCSIWFYFDKNENRKVIHKPFLRQSKTLNRERCNILKQGCVSHQSSSVFRHSVVPDHPDLHQNLPAHKFPSETQRQFIKNYWNRIYLRNADVFSFYICNLTSTCLYNKLN